MCMYFVEFECFCEDFFQSGTCLCNLLIFSKLLQFSGGELDCWIARHINTNRIMMLSQVNIYHQIRQNVGVLASESWWEAWQPSPKVTRSYTNGQRQSWKTPGELGVSKSMECDIFHSVLWHCSLGDRKGIRPVKKLGVGLLVLMIWLELCTIYSSSCHHHFHHPLLQ